MWLCILYCIEYFCCDLDAESGWTLNEVHACVHKSRIDLYGLHCVIFPPLTDSSWWWERHPRTFQPEHLLSSSAAPCTVHSQIMLQMSHLFFSHTLRKLYVAFSRPNWLWKELPETLAQFVYGLLFIWRSSLAFSQIICKGLLLCKMYLLCSQSKWKHWGGGIFFLAWENQCLIDIFQLSPKKCNEMAHCLP